MASVSARPVTLAFFLAIQVGCSDDAAPEIQRACAEGEAQACYSASAATEGVGLCHGGTRSCRADGAGFEEACEGEVVPHPESCATAEDDDCDGEINEACPCEPGETMACYSGAASTEDVGACKAGAAVCLPTGAGYGPCTGEILPEASDDCATAEDENCDGKINEASSGCVCSPGDVQACYEGPAGTQNQGICVGGTKICLATGDGFGSCTGQTLPGAENCATLEDENCDGQVNEPSSGCVCTPNAVEVCYDGPLGTAGIGACAAGTRACLATGDGFGVCAGQVLPAVEDCATPIDENCDGQVNEATSGCAVCQPNDTQTCYGGPAGTQGVGMCTGGTASCIAGAWGPCAGEQLPITENPASLVNENCVVDHGETLWMTALPNSGLTMAVDGAGGAVVMMRRLVATAGYDAVNPASYPSLLVGRYDASGALSWGKEVYSGNIPTGTVSDYQIEAGENGHVALSVPAAAGSMAAFGPSPVHTASNQAFRILYSVDPNGTLLFAVDAPRYSPLESSVNVNSVAPGPDGSLFYSNATYSPNHVLKYDPSGAVAWDHVNTASAESVVLAALPDGGLVYAASDGGTVDLGLGPLFETSPGSRDLLIARYDASGACLWSVRPSPTLYAYHVAVSGNEIGIVTVTDFIRASLVDGTILSSTPLPAGLGYATGSSSLVGATSSFSLHTNQPTMDFGFGPQAPYSGNSGHFYAVEESAAARWARAPGPSFSATRVAARTGGFLYATITGHNQLDFDGTVQAIPATQYLLVRMAY